MLLNKFITSCCALTFFMGLPLSVSAHDNVKVVVVPLGGDEAPTHKTLFVTSSTYNGDLMTAGGSSDGPDGADKLCMQHAEAAGSKVKGKIFKAWLSSGSAATFNGSNREFVIHNLPYHNVNGQLVFNNLWDLYVSPIAPITLESGGAPSGSQLFSWTGIWSTGEFVHTCSNWTTGESESFGGYGTQHPSFAGPGGWTGSASVDCAAPGSIMCFEQ